MKTEWDYTSLAEAYLKRPEYADEAIDEMLKKANLTKGAKICDVGAGAAHLTIMLAKRGMTIFAVEPNDAMRVNGMARTKQFSEVQWFEGVGEHTGMSDNIFDMVTFGSSFNVCNREEALQESYRILKPMKWFACMWNHRDLNDSLQQEIETIIKKHMPNYSYGARREDQTEIINRSNLFQAIVYMENTVVQKILATDFIEGWKSHGTLHRQSGVAFDEIIADITDAVKVFSRDEYIEVPYTTRIWMAQRRD